MDIKIIKELVKSTTMVDIDTKRRLRPIVEARALYYKLCRDYTFHSLAEIGKSVGRDHATVLWGIQNFNNWSDQNVTLKSTYLNLKTSIEDLINEESVLNASKEGMLKKYLLIKEQNLKLTEVSKELSKELEKVKLELKKRNEYFRDNGYVVS